MRTILGNIIQANKIFKMIKDGDKIAVGVSGGKDSMCLLYALSIYKKKLKEKMNWNIDIIGIHLKMNLCAIDYEPIIKFWDDIGIKFVVVPTHMGEILKAKMKKQKIQCSLCSKMKKAILIDEAKKYNCNKIAMGHHADDAIETLFMNMINEGRIATFKPVTYLDRSNIEFIRPIILARESDLKKCSRKMNIPVVPCGCPMEGFTNRDSMKHFLKSKFYDDEKMSFAYKNFYGALLNGKGFDLWFMNNNRKVDEFDLHDFTKNDGKII